MKVMIEKMKEKFDKHWSQCNLLMVVSCELDPRFKLKVIEMCFPLIYPPNEAQNNVKMVREALYEMYSNYVKFGK